MAHDGVAQVHGVDQVQVLQVHGAGLRRHALRLLHDACAGDSNRAPPHNDNGHAAQNLMPAGTGAGAGGHRGRHTGRRSAARVGHVRLIRSI